jgi:hypothetical protein
MILSNVDLDNAPCALSLKLQKRTNIYKSSTATLVLLVGERRAFERNFVVCVHASKDPRTTFNLQPFEILK